MEIDNISGSKGHVVKICVDTELLDFLKQFKLVKRVEQFRAGETIWSLERKDKAEKPEGGG